MINYCRKILNGKIIDIHTHSVGMDLHHLIVGKYPISQNIYDLSRIVRDNGIDYAVTFPQCTTLYYDTSLIWEKSIFAPSGFCQFPYQYENFALVSQISKLHLDNLIPFISISSRAKASEQISYAHSLWGEFGIYGLKFHPTTERSSVVDFSFKPFIDLAIDLNIPILVHTAHDHYAHPMHAIEIARRHPKLRICLAHAARFDQEVLNIIKKEKFKNVFIDCAPLVRLCSIMQKQPNQEGVLFMKANYNDCLSVLQSLYNILPDNILWGSDIPANRFLDETNNIVDYTDDVKVLKQFEHIKTISKNSINFLFGY